MNKKRTILYSVIMVMILITQSFAAIVSDNDGSAFVTKSEFEALKTDFANQIQTYNESIDNKIDGAIASYLAGIQQEKKVEQESLINKINDDCGDSYKSGTTEHKYGYRCMAKSYTVPTTQKPEGAIVNFFTGNILGNESNTRFGCGWVRVGLTNASRTGLYDVNIPDSGMKTGKYIMLNKYNGKYYPGNVYNDITYRYYVTGSGAAATFDGWPQYNSTDNSVTWTFPEFRITETEYWKIDIGNAKGHWDDASTDTWDNIKVFFGGSYTKNETINVIPVTGKISTSSNVFGLLNDDLTRMRVQENSYDWSATDGNVFRSRLKVSDTWQQELYFSPRFNPNLTFYFNCHPYDNSVKLSDLIDYNATIAYGDGDVAIYGGLPLFKATNNGIVTMKIIFKSHDNHDVYVGLKTSQFANDETYTVESALNLRNENDVKYSSNKFERDKEYTFVMDVKKDQVVWIKTYDASSDTGFTGAVTSSIYLVSD